MGQYFVAVNHDKREMVCPWCLNGLAKLFEWMVNPQAGVFPYLLRRSTGSGGGDVDPDAVEFAGRWAGDRVELVGDYDDSGGYQRAFAEYTNISPAVAAEHNRFVRDDDLRLGGGPCGSCRESGVTMLEPLPASAGTG